MPRRLFEKESEREVCSDDDDKDHDHGHDDCGSSDPSRAAAAAAAAAEQQQPNLSGVFCVVNYCCRWCVIGALGALNRPQIHLFIIMLEVKVHTSSNFVAS